jgi:hypothetical protein
MSEDLPMLSGYDHVIFLKLAREIAMDIRPVDEILAAHSISPSRWEAISTSTHFQSLLKSEIESWQSATNTAERVRLKSLAFVEEALPEFYARAHDRREPLNSRVEVLKTVAKFAGIGGTTLDGSAAGERLSVTINLGNDHSLKIEKNITPTIEHEEVE